MDGVLQLGPFMVAIDRLVAIVLLWIFVSAGSLIASRSSTRVGRVAWIAAGVGIAAARMAYVVQNWAAFAVEPWTIIALWQGGFSFWPGIVAAVGVIVVMLAREWRAGASLLAALVAVAALQLAASSLTAPSPRPMPDGIVIADLNGRAVPLASLKGRPFVLNLWATWCPPCQRELPMFIDVADTSDVPMLLVNQGEDGATVLAYLRRKGLATASIRLDLRNALGQATRSQAMPTTLFVDASWRIQHAHPGEMSRAALLSALRDLERNPS